MSARALACTAQAGEPGAALGHIPQGGVGRGQRSRFVEVPGLHDFGPLQGRAQRYGPADQPPGLLVEIVEEHVAVVQPGVDIPLAHDVVAVQPVPHLLAPPGWLGVPRERADRE
jgi:hypothetical protein